MLADKSARTRHLPHALSKEWKETQKGNKEIE